MTNCDSLNLSNCAFTDSVTAGTGFSPLSLYEYVLVVGEGSTNFRTAEVQAHKSAYVLGAFNSNGSGNRMNAVSQLQPRFRRAGVYPVDTNYQEGQTPSQVMVYVPMDLSGHSSDYYMAKYEANQYSGSANAGGGHAPILPYTAGLCLDTQRRTNTMPSGDCGVDGYINNTNAVAQSKASRAPITGYDAGDAYRACVNASLTSTGGFKYKLHIPSGAEWFKAADWGDLDFDGIIDQGPNAGASIAALQAATPADAVTVRCHVDANPASPYNSGAAETANCLSRYGAENMIGNLTEMTNERSQSRKMLDSSDGYSYQRDLNVAATSTSTAFYSFDGIPTSNGFYPERSGAEAYTPPSNTDWMHPSRGGSYDTTFGAAGRFNLYFNHGIGFSNARVGFRCAH